MKRDAEYLINESPMKAILIFSLPLMLGNFFQQLYTMADLMIAGRFAGQSALAAIGASTALTAVFIAVAIGGGAGASVIISRAFGRRDYRSMCTGIFTAIISFVAVSMLLAGLGLAFSDRIMEALNTPEDILKDAETYLRIYFLGLPFLFMYNILSSVFNSLGKSVIPLCLLIFSSLLNIILDIIAVAVLETGVAGAAWATLISQALSSLLSFIILMKTVAAYWQKGCRLFSFPILKSMSRIALPSIVQQATVNAGMMLVQSVVNGFGSEVLAGYAAAIRIDNIVTVPFSSIGNALSPYCAQNLGAGKRERVDRGWHAGLLLILATGIISIVILQVFDRPLAYLFLGDGGTAVAYSTFLDYVNFLSWFFSILGFAFVTGAVLRGAGRMGMFTLASLLNLSFRVIGSMVMAPLYGVAVVWYVVPVGWTIYFTVCYLSYRHLKKSGSGLIA